MVSSTYVSTPYGGATSNDVNGISGGGVIASPIGKRFSTEPLEPRGKRRMLLPWLSMTKT